jgi:hypothetical protein
MSTTDSITSAGLCNEDDYRGAIVLWIARFGASKSDLLTRFGLQQESETVDGALRWALDMGYVETDGSNSPEPEFYLPTSMGLLYVSEMPAGEYLARWIGYVDVLKDRGGVFNRAAASVAAALAVKFESDLEGEYGVSMLDEWQLRALGRMNNRMYRFATRAPVGGKQQLRLPPIILKDNDEPEAAGEAGENDERDYALPIVVEVLTADKGDAEIRNILVNRNNRSDLSHVMCYVADERRGVVLKVIRKIKAQEKIIFYQMPPKIEASALVGLDAELMGDLLTKDITAFSNEEHESLKHVVMCAYHFEVVSISGIADYLEMEEWYVTELVESAVEAKPKLLKAAQVLCDGVRVYSVTQNGVEFLKKAGGTVSERPSSVTITGASEAKDRLRIAAKLARRNDFERCVVMSPVESHDWDLPVPSVTVTLNGRPQLSHPDLTIRPIKDLREYQAVAIITSERDSLESAGAILRAWAEGPVEMVMFFAIQALVPGLKSLARELGVYDRVKIKALPRSEKVVSVDESEEALRAGDDVAGTDDEFDSDHIGDSPPQSGRAASGTDRKTTKRAPQRRKRVPTSADPEIAAREMEIRREDDAMARLEHKLEQSSEGRPKRLDITDPGVKDFEPINDKAALEYEDVLRLYEVDTSRWQVSWRLLVNVAILLIERKIEVKDIDVQTFKVGRDTFEKKVFEMYKAGAWQLLPEIIDYSEKGLPLEKKRPTLKWAWIDPEQFDERIRFACNVRSHFDSDFLGRLGLDKQDGLGDISEELDSLL